MGEAGAAGLAGDAYSLRFAAGVLGAGVGAAAGTGSDFGLGVGAEEPCAPPLVCPRHGHGLVGVAKVAVVAGAAVGTAAEVVPVAWVAADAGFGVAAAA